ncbi:MAG TPA: Ig-like domain-containing protein, partial [Accumulibacter sp.]|nr:Ig-like domain-containing protein [Accumulibacter sp.]
MAPPLTSFGLDPGSDTGEPGDLQTSASVATLIGLAEADTDVRLIAPDRQTRADASGAFGFSDLPLLPGDNALAIELTDLAGNTGQANLTVTRVDPTVEDPVAPVLAAALRTDTGRSNSDGITRDATIAGVATDDTALSVLRAGFGSDPATFVDVLDTVQADGSFVLDLPRLALINGGALPDGNYTLSLRAEDAAGNAAATRVVFALDTQAPAAPSVGLSPASDTGAVGDGETEAARVTLVGGTEANADLLLLETSTNGVASNSGRFFLPDVPLALGDNSITVRAIDAAGNAAQTSLLLQRSATQTSGDAVLQWNDIALAAIQLDASTPPVATRGLAMLSIAVLDTVSAFEGTPGYYVSRSAPAGASLEAAIAAAAERLLSYLYPAQQANFAAAFAAALGGIADGATKTDAIALGRSIADDVIALRRGDGFDDFVDFNGGTLPGQWQATAPMYAVALLPQWATLQPFAMSSPSDFRPAPPPTLDSATYTADFNEVKALGSATNSTRSAEQTESALFWADGAGTATPPGHWNRIAATLAAASGNSLAANARLFAQLNVALADATITAWDAKYHYSAWRPITAIRAADADGNDATTADAQWTPLLINPPFPEYVSGHSTYSGAADAILTSAFGQNAAFTIGSDGLPGVQRSYASTHDAAEEAGRSRIYGGIHFEYGNQAGLAAGRALGQQVLDVFAAGADTQAPRLLLDQAEGLVTASNIEISGRVLDALSGVVTLEGALDADSPVSIAFDGEGRFTLATAFALDGSADGLHTLTLTATDARGNHSAPLTLDFTLDTRAPAIGVTSLADGDALSAASRLAGSADPTGSPLIRLTYAFDGGQPMPVPFDATTGQFDTAFDLAKLATGTHALTLEATDAAGNRAVSTLNLTLPELIPLTITRATPSSGADDVGATFRPKVFFSRPVDVTTLNSSNFYATDTTGARLAATIVPAVDGSFAWLFLQNPMPGASTISVHVVGDTIRAADGGQVLDADGDGMAGGSFVYRFTTVSVTPIAGTTITGRLLDPGDDLKPMTFDDIRSGADGVLHTADDVFLNPIAGAKVYILGLEGNVVYTDADGFFHLDQVPAGNVKLVIDGLTASNAPSGAFYPEMVLDLTIEVGYDNTVMGSMGTREAMAANEERQEVYLPRLQTSILQTVSGSTTTDIGVDAASAPNLTDEQRAHLKLEVQPGTLIDADGNVMSGGQVGISTVPPELVRDMLPPGVLQHTFDITIQAPGVAAFATPLQITFPNVFNAAPGTKLNFLSFDHTTGRLVIEGTATVSADGKSVTTDSGMGITKPGWHGVAPPSATGRSDYPKRSSSPSLPGGALGPGSGASSSSAGSGPNTVFGYAALGNSKPGFQIQLNWPFPTAYIFLPEQEQAINRAATRWARAITGDLPDVPSNDRGFVDDISIDVNVVDSLPNASDWTVAVGGPIELRDGSALPFRSAIYFKRDFISQFVSPLSTDFLEEVALHEIGHALGFGMNKVWRFRDDGLMLVNGSFIGSNAMETYGGPIPLAPDLKHWSETNFRSPNEIMTPEGTPGGRGLISNVTIASMADIGYEVDLTAADIVVGARPLPFTLMTDHAVVGGAISPAEAAVDPVAASYAFAGDFGTVPSPVANGFVGITPEALYSSIRGFGWDPATTATVHGVDRGSLSHYGDTTRDFIESTEATFLVDVPNGIYDVMITLGDSASARNLVQVTLEGELRGNVSTRANEVRGLVYRAVVGDGQFTLMLRAPSPFALGSLVLDRVNLGSVDSNIVPAGGRFAFAIENLASGLIIRNAVDINAGDPLCWDGVTLSPNTPYRQWVVNVDSLEVGVSDFVTPPSGQQFDMPAIILGPSTAYDSDGDGLDDSAEWILGTGVNASDTDADGISDLAEIRQGTDPLGGRALPTGIVAALPLQGQAKAVTLEGSTASAGIQTAYVATGSYGLAIVDASRFQRPLVLGQLDLAGDAVDVALDARLNIAAVAASSALHLVDVSDATTPVRTQTINIPAVQVEAANGIVYAAANWGIEAYSLLTGELLQVLALGSANITSLARDGATLFALDANRALHAVDISGLSMSVLSSLDLPTASGKLFVGDGIAYVGAGDGNFGGFVTADVADPTAMTLLSDVDNNNLEGEAIIANGSGLGIAVGQLNFFPAWRSGLDVVDLRDPTNTGAFLTRIDLPARPFDIAIGAGIAFVAGGTGGLHVVNYLPFDNQGQAPTITLSAPKADRDPATPGIQALEGSLINVKLAVGDDQQVRNVELLLDGQVVANDVSFPWSATVALPTLAATTTATIQARATDTGGNTTLSNALVVDLVPDTFAPTIVASNVADGSRHAQSFRTVRLRFSEALDAAGITADHFRLLDAGSNAIRPVDIALGAGGQVVTMTLPTLAQGSYRLVIDGDVVTDRAGNTFGNAGQIISAFEISEATVEWVAPAGGDWNNPDNWDLGRVPDAIDVVLINGAPGAPINLSGAPVRLQGLETFNPLNISTTVVVDHVIAAHQSITLSGGTLSRATLDIDVGKNILVTNDLNNRLVGVTVNGDLDISGSGAFLQVKDLVLNGTASLGRNSSMAFEGTQRLDGNATIAFGSFDRYQYGYLEMQAAGTLTLAPNVLVRGGYGIIGGSYRFGEAMALVNEGTIRADTGYTLQIGGTSFSNAGLVETTDGGHLSANAATFVNTGVVRSGATGYLLDIGTSNWISSTGTMAIEGGTLRLLGSWATAGFGGFTHSGGAVQFYGAVDNTGSTLTLGATPGSWQLQGATIEGGTLNVSGSLVVTNNLNNRLVGVTVNGDLDISGGSGAFLQVKDLVLNGTASLG